MNWFKKISWAKVVPPDKAVPEEDLSNGLWYYALRLRDGTIIYDSASHQVIVMQNRHLFENGGGLESIGFVNEDGSYDTKMSGSELDEYLYPSKYKKAQSYNTPEESVEWLTRHKIPMEGGKYVFYHGSPKVNQLTHIKAGSLLAETEKDAIHFASRDRGFKPKDITVYKILVGPEDINTGVFASLNRDYNL